MMKNISCAALTCALILAANLAAAHQTPGTVPIPAPPPAQAAAPAPAVAIPAPPPAQVAAPAVALPAAVAVPAVAAQPQQAVAAPVSSPVKRGAAGFFPALPPSRACEERDIAGMWKLRQVYENPVGTELQSFNAQPSQYIDIRRNSGFADYRSAYNEPAATVQQKLDAQAEADASQYVLNQGFLYLYKNGVASDTQACFIVANRSEPFNVGELLLMPTADKEDTVGRRVKVFEKIQTAGGAKQGKRGGGRRGKKGQAQAQGAANAQDTQQQGNHPRRRRRQQQQQQQDQQ